MFKTILGSAIALSVSSAPVMAAPAPFAAHSATTLSTAKSVRSGTATKGKSNLGGDGFLIAIVGAIAIIVGVILIADDQDVATSS